MKVFIICILLLFTSAINAKTYEVGPQENCDVIAEAYSLCEDGDTIVIREGVYEIDTWQVNKRISVIGVGRPLLQSLKGNGILTVQHDSVLVTGLRFTGVKTNYLKEEAAIRIRNSKNFTVANNIIQDCFFAIYLERTKKGEVRNNVITGDASTEAGSGNGVHAWYCDDIFISENDISKHRDGIYLEFVNNSMVSDNYSHENTRYGLHYMFSNDDSYVRNVIEHNGVGVAVMFSRRIVMKDNKFSHNWGNAAYGLLLKEIYDAEIEGNQFEQNTVGVFVEGSNRINYTRNTFRRNGWAIKFSGGCETNRIFDNAFLYNSMDLVVSSQLNDNSFDGNYWSDYSGYDLDRDGVGDVPHFPVKLYSYVLDQVPEAVVLMRSLFIDIINYSERVSPVFTPKDVLDHHPKMSIGS